MIFLCVKACDSSPEGMTGVTWMTALKDHGKAGLQEKQHGKSYHETTSQRKKSTRVWNVKVSVTFHMRKTLPILKLLLYIFIYFVLILLHLPQKCGCN